MPTQNSIFGNTQGGAGGGIGLGFGAAGGSGSNQPKQPSQAPWGSANPTSGPTGATGLFGSGAQQT